MKLVMTMLVRDEEDIVGDCVGFHLDRGVDLVLVTDNGSLDGTRDALAPFERDGVVRIVDEPDDDYRQSEWVTRMARSAACEHSADWLLHCDADEFWWADGGLRNLLAAAPPGDGVVIAPRQNLVPCALEGAAPFHRRLTLRDTRSHNALGVPLFAKCAHRAHPDVVVAQGNHHAEAPGLTLADTPIDVTVLHVPIRSYAQFERKVVLGGRAYARNHDLPWAAGNTWRVLYEAYLDGRLPEHYGRLVPTAAEVRDRLASGRYVVDDRLSTALSGTTRRRGGRTVVADRPPPLIASPRCPIPPASAGAARVEVILRHRVEGHLVALIDAAVTRLDLAAPSVTACAVLAALDTARRRGVDVRILTADPAPLASWRLPAVVHTGLGTAGGPLVLRDGADTWLGFTPLRPDGPVRGPAAALHIDNPPVTGWFTTAFEEAWRGDAGDERAGQTAGSGRDPVGLPDGEIFAVLGVEDAHQIGTGLLACARRVRRSAAPCLPLLVVDDVAVVVGPCDLVLAPRPTAVTLVVRSRTVAADLRPLTTTESPEKEEEK